jgi:hypothetical protein
MRATESHGTLFNDIRSRYDFAIALFVFSTRSTIPGAMKNWIVGRI